jgi:ceramide glucosyltransferase
MTEFALACALFALLAALLHLASTLLAARRLRSSSAHVEFAGGPPVSLLRTVRGLDPYDELTLRSGFELTYPNYELILCCDDTHDPVVPVIRRLMTEHPNVKSQLLIGRDNVTANPKLNNLIKGWRSANCDWVVMADSNVLMPPDYIDRLLMGWRADVGLLCAPPIGCMPDGFWAEVECAFLNTYQARWQYAADSVGLGFAQGKTMLWRRVDLAKAGGIQALGAEIAEDAAATKVVRRAGRRVRLVDGAFAQPLGHRTPRQVWQRQVRWAKLRRTTFPAFFLPEVLSGSFAPLFAATWAAQAADFDPLLVTTGLAAFWYACDAYLARAAGWPVRSTSLVAWMVRDLMLPVLWAQAWIGNTVSWRGNEMKLADAVAGN